MSGHEVVVVTGASKGVGRAVAERFARDGARLALLARGRQGLERTAREVERLGGVALPLPTDVADYDAVDAAAAATEEALGPIDVWVNDAMTTVFAFFEEIEPEEFRRATEVTYLGSVWGTKAALERMRPRDRGAIVQVGSAMAYRGIPLQSPYCGAKHAMKGFFESLRSELRHQRSGVHVSMVQLPGLNTPQFDHCRSKMRYKPMPVPPIYQPEVAADAVHFAAHHRRRQIYVGAPTVYTILGERIAPWLGDWYMARTGVGSQLTEQPIEPPREGNLFAPVDERRDAHGDFDQRAHPRSAVLWASKRRRQLAGSVLAGAAVAAGAAARLRT
ncbi:MAG TPA: SDR family oxidoreductase [Solirubrobacteraceae bacterium]|nr:SDR family oxidoreductase [Solirubrobacteraceae bacterium]